MLDCRLVIAHSSPGFGVFLKLILIVLLLVLLIGFGVLGIVLRGLFGLATMLRGGASHDARVGSADASRDANVPERVIACARCGVHVPESEGVYAGGEFFCCEAHRRGREDASGQ
ncbi:MAG: hypothetical protein LBR05_03330 [Azoarcus sp.]|nr:hypothetical protein [Azoarcus sp.]